MDSAPYSMLQRDPIHGLHFVHSEAEELKQRLLGGIGWRHVMIETLMIGLLQSDA